jgi:hypothetical protein
MAISEDIIPSSLVNIEIPHPLLPPAFHERIVRGSAIAGQNGNFQADSTLPENRRTCPRLGDPPIWENAVITLDLSRLSGPARALDSD